MPIRRLASVGLAAAVALTAALPAGAQPRSTPVVDDAVAWLATQQQPDGGFEVAGFPGFETPDAILALAAAGQPGSGWDPAAGLAAVEAVRTEGDADALDGLDDWIDSVQSDPEASAAAKAQQAAKVIVLVAEPLGLDATDLDPSGDTEGAVDLTAALQAAAGEDGTFAALPFAGRAYALWALATLDLAVDPDLVPAIEAARDAAGGWNYLGDPSGTELDVDTTAIAAMALVAAGRTASDASVRGALLALARAQRWTGQWAGGFDDGNPNSTALVLLTAATVAGDAAGPCWRELADLRWAGVPYPSPTRAIARLGQPDGRIASPTDGFGINTFPTSQAVQGLMAAEGSWPYTGPACTVASPGASRRLVNAHYSDLVGRLSDEAGAAVWAQRLDDGMTSAQVARRFTLTREYGERMVDRIARRYLDRAATVAEREAWTLVTGGRRLEVVANAVGTEEYRANAGGTDAAWVEAAYLDLLGRPADAGATQWALAQLAAGRTRESIARTLVSSTEGLRQVVSGIYQDLLRRTPDTAGRDHWVAQIRGGRSPESLVFLIAGSSEYVALTAPAS